METKQAGCILLGSRWKHSVQSCTGLGNKCFAFFLKEDNQVDVQNKDFILCEIRAIDWKTWSYLHAVEELREKLYSFFLAICGVLF